MKYGFIFDHREAHRVGKMAALLGVTRSGYYAWAYRGEGSRRRADRELLEQIRQIQQEVKRRYGSPRVTRELARGGRRVGHNRVARLMRENDMGARPKRRFRVTTKSDEALEVAENTLNREFKVAAPDQVWVSDITYIATAEGWLYLCVVLDLYSRRVVGWSMGRTLVTELTLAALMMAVTNRRPPQGLLFHSDRGVQYCAIAFRRTTKGHQMRQSMSRKGNCWDNACAETFFKSLKRELIRERVFASRAEARAAIFEYLEVFYNRRRLHSYLGYLTPVEYEERLARKAA